jgi:hypothetical protein
MLLVCGCILCVTEENKAIVAKQWQCYTSVCFCPGRKMSDRLLEQCINIKFYAKLGKVQVKLCSSGVPEMFLAVQTPTH